MGKVFKRGGKVRLQNGKAAKDTSGVDCPCCGATPTHIQAKECDDDTAADLWFEYNGDDGTIVTDTALGDATPLPFYFSIGGVCYYVEANNTKSDTPGTLASGYTEQLECCCTAPVTEIWVFRWTARYDCTGGWTGPTQSSRACEATGEAIRRWYKTAVDSEGCDYEFVQTGPCCLDEMDPPDWPDDPSLPDGSTCCSVIPPCDNYCQQTSCDTERLYYDCPINTRTEIEAVTTCGGKTVYYAYLDGGGCSGGNCEWSITNGDTTGFLPDVRIQFHCHNSCTGGGAYQRRVQGTVEYSPGTDCDGQSADFVCGDITELIVSMHDPKILNLYRSPDTTVVGTLWYSSTC